MRLLITFLFVKLLPLVYSFPSCALRVNYDFYQLTLTWPSTFCATGNQCKASIKKGETKFVVHGLWPGRYDRGEVKNCCNEDYNKMKYDLKPIQEKLIKSWPSMRDDNEDSFWRYEWNKHGTCALGSAQTKGVKNYFESALKLVEKLNLDNTMKKIDFSPNDNPSVTRDSRQLENALKNKYGVKPKIRCIKVSPTTAILEQISFCYDKSLKMIDCQGSLQCARKMIIPTYKTDLSKFNINK